MTRPRVRFEFINSEGARRATFKKRRDGLMKKLNELTTLCGIEACAVIFGPFNPQPDVWPNLMGVHHVISHYKMMPGIQKRSVLDQQSFIKQRIAKTRQQLEKVRKETRLREMELMMQQCLAGMSVRNLSISDMYFTSKQVEKKMVDVEKKMKMEKEEAYRPQLAAPAAEANDQSSKDKDKYVTFGASEDNGLHLAFGDISREENDFWFNLFP